MRRVREVWRDKLADIEVTTVREAQRCIEVLRKDEKESYSGLPNPLNHKSWMLTDVFLSIAQMSSLLRSTSRQPTSP